MAVSVNAEAWDQILDLLAANHVANSLTCPASRADVTGYDDALDRIYLAGNYGNPYIREVGRRLPVMVACP